MRVATTISATLVAQWPQNYAVGAPRRLDFHSISDDSVPLSNISPHPHPVLHLPRLSQIECELHSHQMLHLRSERLLDPQTHLTRQRGFPIQQARKRLPHRRRGLSPHLELFVFCSPELKTFHVKRFHLKLSKHAHFSVLRRRNFTRASDHSIVSGVSANSFVAASQAKAAARANLPARIDSTI